MTLLISYPRTTCLSVLGQLVPSNGADVRCFARSRPSKHNRGTEADEQYQANRSVPQKLVSGLLIGAMQ